MKRMKGPKEKKERALGEPLHLKAERSLSPKSALTRRPYKPGVHGPNGRRKNLSDFGKQLQEKQKFKLSYGLNERGLRFLFNRAQHNASGDISIAVMELLERRLDNAVFRSGFAAGRTVARQLVLHGHITVNGKRVRSPGYEVKANDVIAIYPGSTTRGAFKDLKEALLTREAPYWLAVDPAKLESRVAAMPREVEAPFQVALLVESFAK
jgi:small subunit ribosomal protein S4